MRLDAVVYDTDTRQDAKLAPVGLARQVAEAAWEKKALGLKILDVRGLVSYTDYLVICSGNTDRQVVAISHAIEQNLRMQKERLLGVEGRQEGRWVLMDYGDVVVHVFAEPERDVYGLEGIWADAPFVDVETPSGLERPNRYS